MARKFIKCTGLNNIFEIKDGYLDTTTIKSSVSSKVNENSIVFLIANANDEVYGYPNGNKYIWTQKILYSCNDIQIGVDSSNYLSISSENGVNILDISVGSLANYEEGGLATVEDVYNVIKEDEEIIAGTIADLRNEIIENEEVVASAIAKINNNVEGVKVDISTLDEVVSYALTDLDYRIQHVDNNVSILNADVNSVKDQVVIINTSINTINSSIQNISTQLFDSSIILSKGITLDLISEIKTDSSLPTSKAVIEYVNNKLAGGVTFKGEFIPNTSTTGDGSTFYKLEERVGDMYVASAAGTFLDTSMEAGDAIIFKVDISTNTYVTSGQVSFVEATTDITAYNPTLNFGQTSKIATIDGRDLNVTLPEVDVDDFVTKTQFEEVEEVIATHINNFADGVGVNDNYKVEWSASSGIPSNASTIKEGIEYVATHTTDEKVKQTLGTISTSFPILASNTASPESGETYEAIYDTGITIDPSRHSIIIGGGNGTIITDGNGAHAEGIAESGSQIKARGIGAFAKGYANKGKIIDASGLGAFASGDTSIMSRDVFAYGAGAHAFGEGAQANGVGAFAEGCGKATGSWTHAEGYNTSATLQNSHAEGSDTKASNSGAHAEGFGSEAAGRGSHTEGFNTYATGQGAHAEGISNKNVAGVGPTNVWLRKLTDEEKNALFNKYNIYFDYIAEEHRGDQVPDGRHGCTVKTLNGQAIMTLTKYVSIDGVIAGDAFNTDVQLPTNDLSIGAYPVNSNGTITYPPTYGAALGEYSHTEGYDTNAEGSFSHAEGEFTNAKGRDTHAGGFRTIADNDYMTAIGKYNKDGVTDAIFALGIGTAENDRKNAHLITTDGKHYIPGIGGYDGTQTDLTNVQDVSTVINGKVSGTGTSGYLTKWSGAHTIENGPQLNASPGTFLKNDGTWATPTDNKTLQEITTTDQYRPLIAANKSVSNAVPTDTNSVTNEVYFANKVFVQPSTGNIYSAGYVGVGKTALDTGCNMVYNASTKSLNFEF